MGCESSVSNFNEEKINHEELKNNLPESTKMEIKSYEEFHKKIEMMINDINSKFKDDLNNLLDSIITEEIFFQRYESLLANNKITKTDFQTYVIEAEIIRKLCKDYIDYNVHQIINERINETYKELTENNLLDFSNLLSQNISIFPKLQKGFVFDVSDNNDYTLNTAKIFKFNKKFDLTEILIFRINISLENFSVLKEISNIIDLNFNLRTIALLIKMESSDQANPNFLKFFENLIIILAKIKTHNFLKVFLLAFDLPKENNLVFPDKFYDSLYGLIKEKKLLALMLISIPLTDELGKKLCTALTSNNTLKVLIIEFNGPIANYLDNLSEAIVKIENLFAFSLAGGGLEDVKVKEFLGKVSNLKIFNYKKEF